MNEHMEAAIEAGKLALCKHYNEWEDGQIVWESPTDIQEEINEFEDATRSAIIAALPHIRAMIAEEIVSQHQDYVCTNYENPGDDDHPRACVWEIIENITHQLTGTNQITDNAAQNAEGTSHDCPSGQGGKSDD